MSDQEILKYPKNNPHDFIRLKDSILEVEGLSAGFKKKILFQDLSWILKSGEIYALTGNSGSGKSTFSRILAGYQKPIAGEIKLDGKTPKEYLKSHELWPVQYLYQSPLQAMNSRWTIKKIIMESGSFDLAHAERLGVQEEWLDRFPHELSGGQLQRVSILRALGAKPRFLIADEITAALDPIAQMKIWEMLRHLSKEHNMGILAISHDENLLHQLAPAENFLHFPLK
ncbi:ABC transporter ATP-binding protein [Ignatzschineria sp. LJL83]